MKDSMVLASYNVRVACDPVPNDWQSRKPRIKESIRLNKLDIFGVQEALKRQVDDILEDTSFAYIGGGREDFCEGGEYSCIFFDTARFSLLEGGTFALSETPDIPGSKSWDTCCPRIASWGKFVDNVTEKRFCYYNTHLDHVSELARINGIKQIVGHAKENAAGWSMILSGDFNTLPETETYAIASAFLKDFAKVSETGHTGAQTTFQNYGKRENCVIDYIFVSEDIRVLRHFSDDRKFYGEFSSDHYPLITELVMP